MSEPWYKDGLRFTCTLCGKCCTKDAIKGEPGYVHINQREIERLAKGLELTVAQCRKLYIRVIGKRQFLKEKRNGDCVFYDPEKKCTIHDRGLKPMQCKTFPFWKSMIRDEENWFATTEICPGSGTGELHPVEELEASAKKWAGPPDDALIKYYLEETDEQQ